MTPKWTNKVLNHPQIYRRFHNKDSFEFLELGFHVYYNMELRILKSPISENNYEVKIL